MHMLFSCQAAGGVSHCKMELTAALLGIVVGAILGLTGAGGVIVSIPFLVFGLHMPMVVAAPVGLTAVGVATSIGAILAIRAGSMRYKAAGLMAGAGICATPLGRWLAGVVPDEPLMLVFAAVLVLVSARMLVQSSREAKGLVAIRTQSPACRLDPATGRFQWNALCACVFVVIGSIAGLLSGLLGVGGGFIIVPMLLAASDLPMKSVVATSMGVIALVSLTAVVAAACDGKVHWPIALPFAAATVAGMLVGQHYSQRLSGPRLQQGFALLSITCALALCVRALR